MNGEISGKKTHVKKGVIIVILVEHASAGNSEVQESGRGVYSCFVNVRESSTRQEGVILVILVEHASAGN